MKLSLIAAMAKNSVIGGQNKLLWHLPADLRYFKAKTTGHHIVMGRNTFESIGGGKLLPNRTSVIVTRNNNLEVPGALVAHSIEDALQLCPQDEEVFVCGGEQIYRQTIGRADALYITAVAADIAGDTYFPAIDPAMWELVSEEHYAPDEKNCYAYSFLTYHRRACYEGGKTV